MYPTIVLSAVNNYLSARLEHFAKFQKRKGKFFGDQKKHLRRAIGRKTQKEKEEEEKKKEQEHESVSGSGSRDDGQGGDKNKDEPPREAKDKGKGKAKAKDGEESGEIRDNALQERIHRFLERKREEDEVWKATSQRRLEVLTGKVRKGETIGEEKWKAAREAEGGASSGRTN